MSNLKRFTTCKLAGHDWAKVSYPPTADGEATGFFLRCKRCGKEDHEAGTHARGAADDRRWHHGENIGDTPSHAIFVELKGSGESPPQEGAIGPRL